MVYAQRMFGRAFYYSERVFVVVKLHDFERYNVVQNVLHNCTANIRSPQHRIFFLPGRPLFSLLHCESFPT